MKHVVFVLDVPAQSRSVAAGGVEAEAGLGLAPQVARPIGAGHDFNVGRPNARALIEFVLDAGIRDLDLVVNVGQIATRWRPAL